MSRAIGLELRPRIHYAIENFIVGKNQATLARLKAGSKVWLFGPPASGKTHLAHALCHDVDDAILVSAKIAELDGALRTSLLVIDDIEAVLREPDAERRLQGAYESMDYERQRILITATCPPKDAPVSLPDLASRLRSFEPIQLESLPHDQHLTFVLSCARQRGIEISERAARYMCAKLERTQSELLGALNRLNAASLGQERRVTIPFIRETLAIG